MFKNCVLIFIFFLVGSLAFADQPELLEEQSGQQRDFINLSGSGSFTSDYIWRGVSQTNGGPAAQVDFNARSCLGLYAGVWGSNVNFDDSEDGRATSEIDYYAGFSYQIEDFEFDLGLTQYVYPKAKGLNFAEPYFKASYQALNAGIFYSSNVFNSREKGTYSFVGLNYLLPETLTRGVSDLSVVGEIGYYHFRGTTLGHKDYANYKVALSKSWKSFSIDVGWSDTNGRFDADKLDDGRVFATLNMSV